MISLLHLFSVIITILLGALTLAGAFASLVSPANSSFMAFIALILPFLLLICAALFIYWLIRFRYWVWIPLIAILANWGYISSMVQNPFRERAIPQTAVTLKVATYNVGRFGKDSSGLSAKRIAFYMYEQQIDVLCFQEFTEFNELPKDSLNKIFSEWEYYVIPKAKDGTDILPLAVYSKYPIINSELITFPYTSNCSMWCDLLVNGKTIRIFNNHLQTTSFNQSRGKAENAMYLYFTNDIVRARQAETLNKLIKESPYPLLVCGDLNTTPSSYAYRMMKGDLKDGFRTSGHGYGYTYRYFKRIFRIDYIFHSPVLRGLDYYSPDLDYGSDHNPVIMEVEV